MGIAIVFKNENQDFLLMHPDGQFLAFKVPEDAVHYMTMVLSKNAEVNGPLSALIFIHEVDMKLIKIPETPRDIQKYLIDFNSEKGTAELYRFGIHGVKMNGLRVTNEIKELKYEVKKDQFKKRRRTNQGEQKEEGPQNIEPESPKASSDDQNPYEK